MSKENNEIMENQVQVVDAIPDDVYGIRNVQRVTWLATYPNERLGITREDIESRFANDDTDEGKKRMEERKQRFYQPNVHTWVAKDSDNIVGFCVATKEENNGRIRAIYLLPEYQGKGAGRQLMEAGLAWLGSDKDIYVNVASYNDNAIKFYERFGFVRTGRDVSDPVAALPSGKNIPETEMVKRHILQ